MGDASRLKSAAAVLAATQLSRAFALSTRAAEAIEARGWVESDQPLWRRFERTVRDALAELPDGATFVDLGGGRSCVYAESVPRDRGVRLVAVDVSADELALNQDADEKVVADVAQGLPFADGAVDLLVSRVVLEHVDGVPAAVSHMARAIRPGGRTIHFVPGRWSTFALAARLLPFGPLLKLLHFAIPSSAGVVEFDVHYDQTDPVALERVFRRAGFRDVQVSWTAAQAAYFRPVLPLYVLVALYQTLVRALGLRRLAAYLVVDARR